MARYKAHVETGQGPEEVFAYLSDFSSVAEWDPGVVSAEKLTPGEVHVGTRFSVHARFLGRDVPLEYEVIEIEAPARVVLRAETGTVVSLDEMRFSPTSGGTRVDYDADLRLKGALRLFEPGLRLAFRRVGDNAARGMEKTLAARARGMAGAPS
jgi:carbon monoxide dehydrogenase subunit G